MNACFDHGIFGIEAAEYLNTDGFKNNINRRLARMPATILLVD